MKDEAAFNVLSFLLETVLFTGMVGTALAVRFRRKNQGNKPVAAPAPVPGAATPEAPGSTPKVWSGEMTPEELAERRHQMMNVAYTLGVVVISGMVAVAIFFWRHHSS